jgi:hypothetical protein
MVVLPADEMTEHLIMITVLLAGTALVAETEERGEGTRTDVRARGKAARSALAACPRVVVIGARSLRSLSLSLGPSVAR